MKMRHEEGLGAGCDDVLIVFSFLHSVQPCLLFVVENAGSSVKKRRIEDSPRVVLLSSRGLSNDVHIARFLREIRSSRSLMTTMMTTIRKKTDCFSNGHQVPHGSCGEEDFLLSNGTRKRNGRASLSISRTNTPSYQIAAARSLWPCNFFRAFVLGSLVYVLDGLPLRRLRSAGGKKTRIRPREQKESC